MLKLVHQSLRDLGVERSSTDALTVWYGQPHLAISAEAPFVHDIASQSTGLEILKAILTHTDFLQSTRKPEIVVLPELSLPFSQVEAARDAIAKAPKGTLVVFGIGHMTLEQALSIENKPELWETVTGKKYTNCAAVGVGGQKCLFLQPKIVESTWEQNYLLRGKVVRAFEGKNLRFAVFVCSDLLNAPNGSSQLAWLRSELKDITVSLPMSFWLQHNEKPRSGEFSNAMETLGTMAETTMVVVGSRPPPQTKRYENFGVSGALAVRRAFPSQFQKLTHEFHYVERVTNDVSRAVLLRYDADAYRVVTVLADDLGSDAGAARGQLFREAQPYLLGESGLAASPDYRHVEQLCDPARQMASTMNPALAGAIGLVANKLGTLNTRKFLAFLDMAIVPRPTDPSTGHCAGDKHVGGDLLCSCWRHRVCVDLLGEPSDKEPLAHLLETIALVESAGCNWQPGCDDDSKANLEVGFGAKRYQAVVLYPFGYDIDQLPERVLKRAAAAAKTLYLYATDAQRGRPAVNSIDVGHAPVVGSVDVAIAVQPMANGIYRWELRDAVAAGNLEELLAERTAVA